MENNSLLDKAGIQWIINPWDELAVAERKEACILFNKARYSAAAEIFARTSAKVSQTNKAFFEAIMNLPLWKHIPNQIKDLILKC